MFGSRATVNVAAHGIQPRMAARKRDQIWRMIYIVQRLFWNVRNKKRERI